MTKTVIEHYRHLTKKLFLFQARLILGLFYITVLTPIAALARRVKPKTTFRKSFPKTSWQEKDATPFANITALKSQ